MKIPLYLNNKKIVLSAEPTESLLSVLRKEKLYSVKCGCQKGMCGNCMILLNDKSAASCLIPVGITRDCHIITLEYFQSNPCYQDIIAGFSKAGINLCGYCNAGKIFTAYTILKNYYRPTLDQIYSAIKNLDSCCTDFSTLTNGILYAVAEKHAREGKSSNAKK
ncbi:MULTISPECIES: (2Fe-2S)-binding protein [Treponema]|uniref:Ferredoxin n=1 Tax=Treponema succinifaciens (strain ATCC 33096 / DSM 2489 / 6091) TaxID=869209 RepID=F2NVJ9_TRES6|nr:MULTISPECIES: 2Fe-2S iron-sulfur cluster-binding protein [Treponema]AEB13978.1 ferredoxin [Treponema succinifaciens DSM 2489]MCI6911774.1 2Fe-2S iron-sulfur cluster-binding protein [Treponema succinifaciens]MDD6962740.1 2Fe-2S iron-sulfur cluster-binding protein [Treponema succinifaciens]MDY2616440.1 2Fe-2S iron-sulfur cluster-binding protein [Treponema succinifaciens]MDY5117813.1 2Fe-2S iron-sulfur cluster-binding protein [Treponema succinifaciens]